MIFRVVLFAWLSLLAVGDPVPQMPSQFDCDYVNKNVLSKSILELGLDFFKALDDKAHKNLVFSPLGIEIIYSMLVSGAKGETKNQLLQVLKLSKHLNVTIPEEFNKILTYYKKIEQEKKSSFNLNIASLLMANQQFTFNEEFHNLVKNQFLALASSEDFTKSDHILNKVNMWVKEKTNSKINKLLTESISPDTLLILANAIYFKGEWKEPFLFFFTEDANFYKNEQESYLVKMMNKHNIEAKYIDDEISNIKAIQLPYHGNINMYIILPKTRSGFKQVKESLTADKIMSLFDKMNVTSLKLKLPKFKIESEIDLNSIFPKLGLVLPFSDAADFSKISEKSSRVSKSFQKSMIDVNEKGTEAAAGTAAISVVRASFDEPNVSFIANHPFIFLLRDENSQVTLFMGQVKEPQPSSEYPSESDNPEMELNNKNENLREDDSNIDEVKEKEEKKQNDSDSDSDKDKDNDMNKSMDKSNVKEN